MASTFYIAKATNGEYYFYMRAGNGEKILTSETYKSKASAQNGIDVIKREAPGASVIDIS